MPDASHPPQRPLGITVLSVLLGWLAIAGLGNAIVWHLPSVKALAGRLSATAALLLPSGALFTFLAVAYGVTAAASSIGLWRMKTWAPLAYLSWCASLLALGIYISPRSGDRPDILGLAFALGMVGFSLLAYPYVRRRTASHAL